jgi:hypothetical protein
MDDYPDDAEARARTARALNKVFEKRRDLDTPQRYDVDSSDPLAELARLIGQDVDERGYGPLTERDVRSMSKPLPLPVIDEATAMVYLSVLHFKPDSQRDAFFPEDHVVPEERHERSRRVRGL